MIKTTSIAAAAAALVLTGLTFSVAAPAQAKDVTVSYADLNLTTVEGQKALNRRLDAAARNVCAYDELSTGTLIRDPEAVACYKKARIQSREHMAMAVDRANHTRVAAN